MYQTIHVARVLPGIDSETGCPCTKLPCGYVDISDTSPECTTHTRRGTFVHRHPAERCPGKPPKHLTES